MQLGTWLSKLARLPCAVAWMAALAAAPACRDEQSALAATNDARPADAPEGTRRAYVLHADGDVRIATSDGKTLPAVVNLGLVDDDELRVASGAFALLLLDNRHVVRVDDVHTLKVRDLLMLGARPTREDVASQVRSLLHAGERAPRDAELRERVAGWHARLAAVDTVPVQDESEAPEAYPKGAPPPPAPAAESERVVAAPRAKAESHSARSNEARRVEAGAKKAGRAPPPPPMPATASKDSPTKHVLDEEHRVKLEQRDPGVPAWTVRRRAGSTTEPLPVPAGLAALAGRLDRCLRDQLAGLGVRAKTATLILEVREGRVTRVAMAGALRPSCGYAELERLDGLPDGLLEVEIPIAP